VSRLWSRVVGGRVAHARDSWEIYLCDKAGAVGWGWPSSESGWELLVALWIFVLTSFSQAFDDEEITTPWPKDDYTNVSSGLHRAEPDTDELSESSPKPYGTIDQYWTL
jgi:hypothetical protein